MKRLIAMLLTFAMLMSLVSISAFAAENEPDTGLITENTVWNDGDIINGATIKGDVTITVKGTVTIAGTIKMGSDSIHKVTIKGETADAKLIRGNDFTGQMFYVEGTTYNFQSLIFKNITLDGGAVWTGEKNPILDRGTVNSGIKATGSVLYLVRSNATLENCILQNQDDSTGEKGNAVFLREYASIAFNDSIVRNNNSPSSYWKGGVVTTRYGGTVTTNNSEVYGNSGTHGAFVGVSSSGSYGTKVDCVNTKLHNNYASTGGALCYLQDNSGIGYVKLTGCTVENNGSPLGLFYSYAYFVPTWIKDTTFANNACAMYEFGSDNRGFSVAGNTQISGSYSNYLFGNPVRIFGALDTTASLPLSEASVSQLMSKYGYLATATPDIPYHYNHTGNGTYVLTYEYTWRNLHDITLTDLAQFKLYENNGYTGWALTDVDGNGMLDAVPVSVAPTTVNVTLIDTFKGTSATQTQDVSNVVKNVPVCHYEHSGYFFNGWLMEDGTLIKDVNSNAILAGGEKLTATWAVARPRVSIAASTSKAMEGESITLTASISNMDAENLNYTYQWYRSGTLIEGATGTTYTVTEDEAGYYTYKCVAVASDDDYTSDTDYAFLTKYGSNTYYKSITLQYTAAPAVAEIVETGVQYKSLAAAIAAANESEGADTIKMLTDIDFDAAEALPINGVITITGKHTISRGNYAGTLFTVPAGSTLTLDGGLIIDGNNNWVMDKAAYEKDRDNMVQVLQDDCEKYFTFVDGETKATDFMITNAGGTVNLNAVTIQNNYSYNSGVVKVTAANAITNLKGATVTHVASATGNGVVVHSNYASTITVDGETLITKNHVGGNHGLFMLYSGTKLTMNNGEISHTTGWNSNGTVVGVYGTGSEFTMNGGLICSNSSVWGKDNQRNPAVYIHSSGKMTMNGGTICHNIGKEYGGGIGSYKASSVIIINAGMVVDNSALNNDYRTGAYLERGDDVDAPASDLQISGGIYTHDVSEECAPGFVCLPYDRDVSKYCDLSYAPAGYNENSRDNDYIVLPGYKISYYIVENVNGETTEKQVHEEFLLIPANKTHDQVDLFANHYDHLSDDQKQAIKTWYTTNTMDAGTEFNYSTEVTANINLYGATWEEMIYVAEIVETGKQFSTIADAVNAAESGQTVKVLKDHEMDVSKLYGTNSLIFVNGNEIESLTIDFNGKTVTVDTGKNTSGKLWTIFYARFGAKLTITGDGTIKVVGDDKNRPYLFWSSASTITIENGTYDMDNSKSVGTDNAAVSHTFYASSAGSIFIKDGLFTNNGPWCIGNLRDGSGSKIVASGGTYDEHPVEASQGGKEFTVADGHAVINNGNGTWSISPYITVTFDNQNMVFGNKVPELTYTVDYGYLAKEVVGINVTVNAIANPASGEHEITGSVTLTDGTGEAKNYAVKIIPGKLTVTRITYTIKYNANGGQYVGSEVNHGDDWMLIKNGYTYNEAVTLHNGEGFQREGYKLVGWTTGSVNYELGETVEENFTNVQSGTVQMYAIWELAEPDEEIEDEDVPLGSDPSNSTEVPKTGDNGVFMNMIIGALALVAMAVLVLSKKKYFID